MKGMVKKYVFLLPDADADAAADADADEGGGGGGERARLLRVNAELHSCLAACKNRIGCSSASAAAAGDFGGHALRQWNTLKRQTNEYELIHTGSRVLPGLSCHAPISRSFFKLWEMLVDFGADVLPPARGAGGAGGACGAGGAGGACGVSAAFLAEGPGGFVEAFAAWRHATAGAAAAAADVLHCITLVSPKRTVPSWKLGALRRTGARVHVHAGADGTGDLYRAANVEHFVAACGGDGACGLVTADGGFDFSGDFNAQEDSSMQLVACQAYAALRLQRRGGALVLKVFDAASAETIAVLLALRQSYDKVRLVKPFSSRPANSERYALCTGFNGAPPATLEALREAVHTQSAAPIRELAERNPTPLPFLRAVVEYNAVYVARQASYIARTVALGHVDKADAPPLMLLLLRRQLCSSIRWCHKYHVPIAKQVFQEYRDRLLPPMPTKK
jgi:hypothetical protein